MISANVPLTAGSRLGPSLTATARVHHLEALATCVGAVGAEVSSAGRGIATSRTGSTTSDYCDRLDADGSAAAAFTGLRSNLPLLWRKKTHSEALSQLVVCL